MDRQEYLAQLQSRLHALSPEELEDVLSDYAEHFSIGEEMGRSDEEIAEKLGSPKTVAHSILLSHPNLSQQKMVTRLGVYFRAILTFIALTPFNFLVFIGPFLVITTVLLLGWLTPGIVIISSLVSIGLAVTAFGALGFAMFGAAIFFLVGNIALSLLIFSFMLWLTEAIFRIFYSYLSWNLNLMVPPSNSTVTTQQTGVSS